MNQNRILVGNSHVPKSESDLYLQNIQNIYRKSKHWKRNRNRISKIIGLKFQNT